MHGVVGDRMSGSLGNVKEGDPDRSETGRGVRVAIVAKKSRKRDGAKGGRKMDA